MAKMTKEEIAKKVNAIINDVLNGKRKLDVKGLKEFKDLLALLEVKPAESYSEKTDLATYKAFASTAEKQLQKESLKSVSNFSAHLDKLTKEAEAIAKRKKAEAETLKQKREEEEYYRRYEEQMNKGIDKVF